MDTRFDKKLVNLKNIYEKFKPQRVKKTNKNTR